MKAIQALVADERLGAVATIISGPDSGAKAVIDAEAGFVAGKLPADIAQDVLADATSLMEREQSRTLEYGDREVFIETVAPRPHLLIFGAVHIAQELAVLAHQLGFHVTVSDARQAFTTPERFPTADQISVGWPDQVKSQIEIDSRTYVVLLSHDARFEDPIWPWALASPAKYLGAMGSRRTKAKRNEKLAQAGNSAEQIDRIHAPIGLDLGAEQPAETAVAIMAEIIRVRYGSGTGESLQGRSGRIHLQRPKDEAAAP